MFHRVSAWPSLAVTYESCYSAFSHRLDLSLSDHTPEQQVKGYVDVLLRCSSPVVLLKPLRGDRDEHRFIWCLLRHFRSNITQSCPHPDHRDCTPHGRRETSLFRMRHRVRFPWIKPGTFSLRGKSTNKPDAVFPLHHVILGKNVWIVQHFSFAVCCSF